MKGLVGELKYQEFEGLGPSCFQIIKRNVFKIVKKCSKLP